MTEIFTNINQNTKELAEVLWMIAQAQPTPIAALNYINSNLNYCRNFLSNEEMDFLEFYFNMKMEELSE